MTKQSRDAWAATCSGRGFAVDGVWRIDSAVFELALLILPQSTLFVRSVACVLKCDAQLLLL